MTDLIIIGLLAVVCWLLFEIHAKLRELTIRAAQIQADIIAEDAVGWNQDYDKDPVVRPVKTVFHEINESIRNLAER